MNLKKLFCAFSVVSSLALGCCEVSFGQGALTPSGGPAPSMKTLQQVEPRTAIGSLPYVITNGGSYYLTTNLTGVNGSPGITISNGNVTLDLNGFALIGTSNSLAGVLIPTPVTNVLVRNGIVQGWGMPDVQVLDGSTVGLVIEDLRVSGSKSHGITCPGQAMIRNCTASGNAVSGIVVGGGTVSGCVVTHNQGGGIFMTLGVVTGCQSAYNNTHGIYVNMGTVRDCVVTSITDYGIQTDSGTVINCEVSYCGESGIFVNAPGSQVIGNKCVSNNSSNDPGDAGIFVNDSQNRIEGNHVVSNKRAGIAISAVYNKNVVIRNTASSNGTGPTNNYVIPAGNDAGPIGTAATATSPWANFSY